MITPNQRRVIGYITANTGAVFEGTTYEEARDFIEANIDRSKRKRREQYTDGGMRGPCRAPKREPWTNGLWDERPY